MRTDVLEPKAHADDAWWLRMDEPSRNCQLASMEIFLEALERVDRDENGQPFIVSVSLEWHNALMAQRYVDRALTLEAHANDVTDRWARMRLRALAARELAPIRSRVGAAELTLQLRAELVAELAPIEALSVVIGADWSVHFINACAMHTRAAGFDRQIG